MNHTGSHFHNKKLFLLISILGMVFSIIQMPSDLTFIKENLVENQLFYILGRIIFFASFLFVFLLNYKKDSVIKDKDIVIIGSLLTLYSCHGQLFLPGYFMAYMQSILSISLFYALPKNKFKALLIGSGILMAIFVFFSKVTYSSIPSLALKFKSDVIVSIFIINILSYFGYSYITLERFKKDLLYKKFLDVGKNSAEIIHNLKGVVFSPSLYISLIEKNINEKDSESLELINKLKFEYNNLVEYIQSLNNLSKNNEGPSKIDAELTINSILKTLFKSKTKGKEITIKDNGGEIFGDIQSFRSMISNLLSNSFENFHLKNIKDPKINIEINNQQIIFSDNGGGFTKKALNKLKHGESFTEKENGSGLGFFLIKDTLEEQGGKVSFYNKNDGAVVELNFLKKELIK